MFKAVEPAESVGFDSQWKFKKITMHNSAQTSQIASTNVATVTSVKANAEIQTEEAEHASPEYDEQRLADWLTQLYPKLSQELNEASSSQVFRNYETSNHSEQQSKLLKSVKLIPDSGDFDKSVSCLSWNATGKKLAISVTQDHDTWCHHTGFIFIYTFQGSANEEEKLIQIRTTNCVTCVCFHPKIPPILAVGTFIGDIMILNTQNEENEQVLLRKVGHDNLVTQIAWVDDLDNSKLDLVASGSLDGSLKLWQFNISSNILQIHEELRAPHFGRLGRQGETSTEISHKVDRGIVAFDFSKHFPDKFVVAAEGGLIAQCSRLGAKILADSGHGGRVLDPVYKYYRAHEGEITSIAFSPDKLNLFASNGSDGEIRIYDMDEEEPGGVIHATEGLLYSTWVPFSQNMLAACGATGWVEFYNARTGKLLATNCPTSEAKNLPTEETCLTYLAFHKIRISVVAVGTKDGILQLWDIPWSSF